MGRSDSASAAPVRGVARGVAASCAANDEKTGRANGRPRRDVRAQPVSRLAPPNAGAIQDDCAPGIMASENWKIAGSRRNSEAAFPASEQPRAYHSPNCDSNTRERRAACHRR
jgi:hypothetical protein